MIRDRSYTPLPQSGQSPINYSKSPVVPDEFGASGNGIGYLLWLMLTGGITGPSDNDIENLISRGKYSIMIDLMSMRCFVPNCFGERAINYMKYIESALTEYFDRKNNFINYHHSDISLEECMICCRKLATLRGMIKVLRVWIEFHQLS